jgi:NADH dehydrogenase
VPPSFDRSLSAAATRALENLGVEVRLGGAATSVDADGVIVAGERIEARAIIWAAGLMASPAGNWLNAKSDRAGRVIVEPDLRISGCPDIFVVGDAASARGADGSPLPGVAPVAKQQGAYVAKRILAELKGKACPPFRYRDFGSLATIGRKNADVQMKGIRLGSSPASRAREWRTWPRLRGLLPADK